MLSSHVAKAVCNATLIPERWFVHETSRALCNNRRCGGLTRGEKGGPSGGESGVSNRFNEKLLSVHEPWFEGVIGAMEAFLHLLEQGVGAQSLAGT